MIEGKRWRSMSASPDDSQSVSSLRIPNAPWQRGSNENTNVLWRQYLPQGTDLSGYTPRELNAIAHRLNTRPRK